MYFRALMLAELLIRYGARTFCAKLSKISALFSYLRDMRFATETSAPASPSANASSASSNLQSISRRISVVVLSKSTFNIPARPSLVAAAGTDAPNPSAVAAFTDSADEGFLRPPPPPPPLELRCLFLLSRFSCCFFSILVAPVKR